MGITTEEKKDEGMDISDNDKLADVDEVQSIAIEPLPRNSFSFWLQP